jgi:TetR/AcrR family transcriptional regulator, lmrAB and yxaGH operons repressor
VSDARDRMVTTAAMLFQRHGYNAVGFRRIVEESGAPRGSIYHHFPGGKEQLGVEAIKRSGEALVRTVERVTATNEDVAGILEELGELLAGWLESSEFQAGCPVATVALECAPETTSVTDACRTIFRSWIEVVADRLEVEGWEPQAAQAYAATTVAAIEGALILARVERDATVLRTVTKDLAQRTR